MSKQIIARYFLIMLLIGTATTAFAQRDAAAGARLDVRQITVGDQARLFVEAQHNPSTSKLMWAAIPDTFNTLEVVERGKIDTTRQGELMTYRQRLVITGFDSGLFKVPAFAFTVVPNGDSAYTVLSDSFELLVNTVPVDTSQAFKPIKSIIFVHTSWRDYILYIVIGVVVLLIVVGLTIYLVRRKKPEVSKPAGPTESLHDHAMRLLRELEGKKLWEKNQVKEYYVELTDIVRNYIEQRYNLQVLEQTTDEILSTAQMHPELYAHYTSLSVILHTADLAKFAKAEPLPQEHMDAMAKAKEFIETSKPVIVVAPTEHKEQQNDKQQEA